MASSKRREWTKIDVRELKSLAREKMPAGKIARRLKRTEGATSTEGFCPRGFTGFARLEAAV